MCWEKSWEEHEQNLVKGSKKKEAFSGTAQLEGMMVNSTGWTMDCLTV